MKATVLIDNIEKNGIKGQWGLSFYIEYEGKKILLDAGSDKLFSQNAEKLGIDICEVDYAVLSHAHYDHADGMPEFFRLNSKADLYLRETCRENCLGRRFIFMKYIGIKRGTIKRFSDRIKYAKGDLKLTEGVYLIPHKTPELEKIGKKEGMLRVVDGRLRHDNFDHEQSLVFDTQKGLVIFNSCSHGGADNIINEIKETFPEKNIYALIGGFHLYRRKADDVKALAERIESTGIQRVITGHCTGDKAFGILKNALGEKAEQLYAGMVIEI